MAEQPRPARQIKPVWSMDVMILSQMNEIAKIASELGIEVENGNLNEIFRLRAVLKELFYQMESFIEDNGTKTIDSIFTQIDDKLDLGKLSFATNCGADGVRSVIEGLNLIRRTLFYIRNELFMKFVVVSTPEQRLKDYLLPPEAIR